MILNRRPALSIATSTNATSASRLTARILHPLAVLALAAMPGTLSAQTAGTYAVTNIISDGYATAPVIDPTFTDPWGFDNTGTFWINANVSGLSFVNGISGPVKLKAVVPPASGSLPGKPTGIVRNTTTGFVLQNGTAASFIFSTLDGTISGWNGALSATGNVSLIKVNNAAQNAVYTDIALDPATTGPVLLAANFGRGANVEIYDKNFAPATLPGTFTDPALPAGYAPYAIHVINNQVYVTYALRSTTTYGETLGTGKGFISVFDLNGNYIKRAITGGNLNAPWGMALAPSTFGVYGGALLVGNLGDGLITAYDPTTYAYLGQLADAAGKPILYSLPGAGVASTYLGLWEIGFGHGVATGTPTVANSGDPNVLYFAAGLDAELHGLFGGITMSAPTGSGGSFGFTSSAPSLTVTAGSAATGTLALAPSNGFAGTVTLACAGLPVNASCTFAPATLSVVGNAPATTTFSVTTGKTTATGYALPGAAFAGLLLLPLGGLALFSTRGTRNRLGLLTMLAGGFLVTAALTGCGSKAAANTATPAGTSLVTITATSGTVVQTTAVSLTVQ